jgi:hypothetical protein
MHYATSRFGKSSDVSTLSCKIAICTAERKIGLVVLLYQLLNAIYCYIYTLGHLNENVKRPNRIALAIA